MAGLPVWLCDCIYEWMFVCSSCGLSGAVVESCAGLGICRLRPRARKSGRRVAFGVVGTAMSSLLSRRSFSRKEGEGARAAGGSDRLRFFAGDLDGVVASKAGGRRLPVGLIIVERYIAGRKTDCCHGWARCGGCWRALPQQRAVDLVLRLGVV